MADSTEIQISSEPSGSLHETPMAVGLGETFGLDPRQVIKVLQTQLIKVPNGAKPATAGELIVVMSTLKKYGLDPMMRQLYAWRDNRGDLACMLSMDGWVELARRNPGYVRVSYRYGPDVPKAGKHKGCWEWVQPTVHTTDRGDVELPPLYLEEWRKDYGQWLEMPRHKMHIIAFRMAIREVYGIALDVRDPEDVRAEYHRAEFATADKVQEMAAKLPMSAQPLGDGVVPGPDSFPEVSGIEDPILREAIINEVKASVSALSASVDESDMTPPRRPEGAFPACAWCDQTGHTRCGVCGKYTCSFHMSENGFQCEECAAKGEQK